jgi:hypothetical protein
MHQHYLPLLCYRGQDPKGRIRQAFNYTPRKQDILPSLEAAAQARRPLLIIAEDVDGEARRLHKEYGRTKLQERLAKLSSKLVVPRSWRRIGVFHVVKVKPMPMTFAQRME